MPEAAYSSALDHIVFTCVDIAFFHCDRLLLAKRSHYPRKSWWVIGGRMVAGENPIETAQRKASEEAQLHNLASERFQYVGVYSTSFALREQAPIHHGSHSVNLTYQVALSEPETHLIQLTSHEYDCHYQWIQLEQINELIDANSPLDQALLQIVQDLRIS
ncbi:NUDIX hydrolase [Phormidium sp. CLA17]|uniref:NUDIX hydrolase n=1 Tax=Leptolyngbya sp. Cla-17 TaxID=2803751 RepID=UPI0018D71BA4|nr:NUDIX hydrolase [Leptolyngbya sp. Cla-17]MBM0742642.1 NUDIX hydrolase [Leptolyngbya sp. Cla-17]